MAKDVKHFQQELRNCMYQLSDDELLALFSPYPMEAERMRQCLKVIDYHEDPDDNIDEAAANQT
jgi:hypothetical protein